MSSSRLRLLRIGLWPSIRSDLDRLSSDTDREHAIRFVKGKLGSGDVIAFLPYLLVIALTALFALWNYISSTGSLAGLVALISYYVFPWGLIYATLLIWPIKLARMWLLRNRAKRYLRWHLNQLGIATCIGCGYDLRGLPSDRCPECGAARFTA